MNKGLKIIKNAVDIEDVIKTVSSTAPNAKEATFAPSYIADRKKVDGTDYFLYVFFGYGKNGEDVTYVGAVVPLENFKGPARPNPTTPMAIHVDINAKPTKLLLTTKRVVSVRPGIIEPWLPMTESHT